LVIGLQLALPEGVTAGPRWLLPALEVVLLGGLWLGTPTELRLQHKGRRRLALALTIVVSAANIANLVLLSHELLHRSLSNGRGLIVGGTFIWLTNVMVFALWYWETDRGGPAIRAAGEDRAPDFLFVQMNDDRIQPADWRPQFIDYLYLSLTNATAFSPTDTMPLTPMAKSMMGVQSIVSLVTLGLIVSRAVNILPG
jgi:uncharacterized membrane protein